MMIGTVFVASNARSYLQAWEAVHRRHDDIHQDEIGALRNRLRDGLLAVARDDDVVVVHAERQLL